MYHDDDAERHDLAGVKERLKRLADPERAQILAWLCTYYADDGTMFSPQITRATRRRIAIDDTAFWLVKIPRKGRP